MNRKVLETGKTVLIVLLAALAVYLFFMARFYSRGGAEESAGAASADANSVSALSPAEAARPVAAAVTTPDGRYAAVSDSAAVSSVYDICAPVLREALGTAQESFLVDSALWLELLEGPGVYLAYSDAIPAAALAQWLGADFGYGGSVVRILMTPGAEDSVMLYLDDGAAVRGCATSAKYFVMDFSSIRPNNGRFAFELSKEYPIYEGIFPYSLILDDTGNQRAVLAASNPLSGVETRTEVLEYLGLNPYADYTTFVDGSILYSSADYQLEISDFYSMSLQVYSSEAFSGKMVVQWKMNETTAVQAALALAKDTAGKYCGQADIGLTGCEYDAELNEYRFFLSYFVNGIRVSSPTDYAAMVVIRDGYICEAQLCFRKYVVTDETSYVLSPKYAAAALPGSELILIYADGGGDTVTANWKR
jgi:hypothetical protein